VDCAGIAAGTASKADNRVAYLVDFDLVVDNDFSFDVVAEAVRQILQQQVAPLVAGCVGRRRMQETSSTGIKNVLFFAPEQSTTGECVQDGPVFELLRVRFHLTSFPFNSRLYCY
jgi:hypothetical protein